MATTQKKQVLKKFSHRDINKIGDVIEQYLYFEKEHNKKLDEYEAYSIHEAEQRKPLEKWLKHWAKKMDSIVMHDSRIYGFSRYEFISLINVYSEKGRAGLKNVLS